jgi:hypothetical protein
LAGWRRPLVSSIEVGNAGGGLIQNER